jgi:hypothetical protein
MPREKGRLLGKETRKRRRVGRYGTRTMLLGRDAIKTSYSCSNLGWFMFYSHRL